MSTKRRYKLTNLVLKEVSLVDRGSNPLSTVVLLKRHPEQETHMSADTITKEQLDAITKDRDGLAASVTKANTEVAFLKEQLTKLNERVTSAEAERDELKKKLKPEEKPVELSPEAKALVEKALADSKAATDALAKMQEERDTEIYVAKARELGSLPMKAEDFGAVLKRIAKNKATPEDVIALETLLKSANALIKKGAALNPGDGDDTRGDGTSAYVQLEAIAKDIAAKENVAFAKAYTLATERNPKLYSQYIAEQQA